MNDLLVAGDDDEPIVVTHHARKEENPWYKIGAGAATASYKPPTLQ